jgi:hypothetical protein
MNVKALFEAYTQLMQNPAQFLQKHGIPQQFSGSSQDAIQYLMNNGKVSQEMYNDANNQLKQLQNNPLFKQYFNKQG